MWRFRDFSPRSGDRLTDCYDIWRNVTLVGPYLVISGPKNTKSRNICKLCHFQGRLPTRFRSYLCKVFIHVSNGAEIIEIDQETRELLLKI